MTVDGKPMTSAERHWLNLILEQCAVCVHKTNAPVAWPNPPRGEIVSAPVAQPGEF